MNTENIQCVLLAGRHHGLMEGFRRMLETLFDAVVMLADKTSLQASAIRLHAAMAVVDLAWVRDVGLGIAATARPLSRPDGTDFPGKPPGDE